MLTKRPMLLLLGQGGFSLDRERPEIARILVKYPELLAKVEAANPERRWWWCPTCDSTWPAEGPPWPRSSSYGGESPPCPNPRCSTHYGVRDWMRAFFFPRRLEIEDLRHENERLRMQIEELSAQKEPYGQLSDTDD
jgi:hypothetical protein